MFSIKTRDSRQPNVRQLLHFLFLLSIHEMYFKFFFVCYTSYCIPVHHIANEIEFLMTRIQVNHFLKDRKEHRQFQEDVRERERKGEEE